MCGRFTLKTPATELSAFFEGLNFSGIRPRYNICPTQQVTCIRESREQNHEVVPLRWGLVPFWAKDLKIGARMINARSETVSEKPSFRAAFKKRRCLVLADGFYEWKKLSEGKQPHFISMQSESPFAMAGLWESWTDKSDPQSGTVETCTVLTTEANSMMEPLHDRMPVILQPDDYETWLDPTFEDHNHLQTLLRPFAPEEMQHWPVATIVNRPANDQPECITSVEAMG